MNDQPVDILVVNGCVLTMNADGEKFENGAVAVRGDTIVQVGDAKDFSFSGVARTIDAKGGIVMPGLINGHTHAAMTLFRGLADDLPLMTWLEDHIFPAEARLDQDKVYFGTLLACAEMIMSGTTCFTDMYLFEDSVAAAAKRSGMRAVVGEVLYDFPSPNYGPLEKGFEYTRMLIEKWKDDPLISIAVEPHSPYLCSPELLKRAAKTARENDLPLIIHLSETEYEVDQIRKRYGRSPVAHLANLGVLGPDLVACHCVVLSAEDIALLKKFDVKVVHDPQSNMKLASGVAPVPELIEAGVCVCIGTDGCASNNNLDMFSEMGTAAKLHKVQKGDPTVMDAHTVLRMATVEAARAIGMSDSIGSLEPGKKADIIVIDTLKPHLTPMYHPESHLVYAARGSDVKTVIVDGRTVMEDGKVVTMDVEKVMEKVREIAEEIRKGG